MCAFVIRGLVVALLSVTVGCGPLPVAPKIVIDQTKADAVPHLPFSRIGVLPVSTVFKRVTFDGENPRRTDIEGAIRLRTEVTVASELRTRGFDVRDAAAVEASFAANPELRFQATQLTASISKLEDELHARPVSVKRDGAQPPMTIGPQVASLAGPLGVDAVLLVSISGYTKSAGELAAEALKGAIRGATVIFAGQGSHMPDRLTIVAGVLIDGATGELLWDRIGWTGGDFESNDLESLVRGLVAPFPLPPAAAAPSGPAPSAPPAVVNVAMPPPLTASIATNAATPTGSAIRYVWSEPTDCRQNVRLVDGQATVVGKNPIKNVNVCVGESCDPIASGRIMATGETSTVTMRSAESKKAAVSVRCSVLRQD